MSNPEDEIIQAGANVVLQPVAKVFGNVLDVIGGNWIDDINIRQRDRFRARREATAERAGKILNDRGIHEFAEANEGDLTRLAECAQTETNEQLKDLWAHLLAAMLDPNRSPRFRAQFIEIATELEPIDAAVLPLLQEKGGMEPNRLVHIAARLEAQEDDVHNAFRNLQRLELTENKSELSPKLFPQPTPLGRQFLACVR